MDNETTLYFQLFLDNLLTHCLLPIHHNWMFATMQSFPYYNYNIMLICAIAGSLIGAAINYMVGRLCRYKMSEAVSISQYISFVVLMLAVMFSWLNILGAFLSFSCGYIKIKPFNALIAISSSHILYYLI